MKKIFLSTFVFLATISSQAQAPQAFSYQAVIRNSSNALVANQNVSERISLIKDSATGTVVYSELQNVKTNANGLVSLQIGNGSVLSGSFNGINWATGTYFVKTETDPTSGSNYTISNTTQLLSVPYALYAADAPSLQYPDGLKNLQKVFVDSGMSYTVPLGKNFYCTNPCYLFLIDTDTIKLAQYQSLKYFIVSSNKKITTFSNNGSFSGFIVDKNVDVLSINLDKGSYTVPNGKVFIMTSFSDSYNIFVNNKIQLSYLTNVFPSGTIFSSSGPAFVGINWINGYLK